MKVLNLHERTLPVAAERVGTLLDQLASPHDPLWPRRFWPRMKFDRPLGVGARGGHGPIRYDVESYARSRAITFRFTGPRGFDGYHALEITAVSPNEAQVKHILAMRAHGLAQLTWPLVFRPLHDALVEDAFTTAEISLGLPPRVVRWSWRVRLLRALLYRGRAPRQEFRVLTPWAETASRA